MIPSSFDAGNPEIVEDFSLSVLIIRLTASSNLSFALDDDFASSAATEASRTTLFVDSEADTVLDADEADTGFFGYRCDASLSRSRTNTSRLSFCAFRGAPARVLANAELGF
jgi:hypothetical protein